jgi:dTDP-glucose pyrophosphorylase
MSSIPLRPTDSLFEAISTIELNVQRMAVVSSEDNRLLGTITDGDIRRYILQGHTLEASVADVMNPTPITASIGLKPHLLSKLFTENNIRGIPLIDNNNKFIQLIYQKDVGDSKYSQDENTFSSAVIMAGGEGKRLRPLTDLIPKPMLEVGGIPLLERQVINLRKIGIRLIYLSVNYLGDIIMNHFGDGSDYNVSIKYLNEIEKLGTAGALSLVPGLDNKGPILVMNGDILTTSDFSHLYHFHEEHNSDITVAATDYRIEIPYGVIQYDGVKVKSIQEKPSKSFFCNAGIYVLTTEIIKKIPKDKFFNMTDVIDECLTKNGNVSVFPLHEYWSDIGTHQDLEHARNKFDSM